MRKHSFTVIDGDRPSRGSPRARVSTNGPEVRSVAVPPRQNPSCEGFLALALMPIQFSEAGSTDPGPFRIACATPQEALGWTVFGLRSPAPCECLSLDGEEMEALRDCGTLIGAVKVLLAMMQESGLPAFYRDSTTPWVRLPLVGEAGLAECAAK